MPSTYSVSLRYELQASGEGLNTWGVLLDNALQRVDDSVAGWATIALTGNVSLTTANGSADQARLAMLKFTGTGAFTVTVPAVSKRYDVWNGLSGVLTLTNGSASVTLQPGEVVGVVNDGGANFSRVQPTDFAGKTLTNVGAVSGLATPTTATQAAPKGYVDAAIGQATFTMGAFGVPVSPGNAGQFLTNNGSTPNWAFPTVSAISDYVADQATRAAASAAVAIAFAAVL